MVQEGRERQAADSGAEREREMDCSTGRDISRARETGAFVFYRQASAGLHYMRIDTFLELCQVFAALFFLLR